MLTHLRKKKKKKKKKKKRGDVTIYCDTPCVRDLGALFGSCNKTTSFDLDFMDSYMLKQQSVEPGASKLI